MTKEELMSLVADVTWCWGHTFFLETNKGNFLWQDPSYSGDDSIVRFDGSLQDFLNKYNLPFGREKGQHYISSYCGESFTFKS